MEILLEGGEQLERELAPEPVVAPAAGSLLLHGVLAAVLVFYGVIGGLFHRQIWGNPGQGGAMQVNLVSSPLPLPNDQPVNQNVLSTETPSHAPAPPAPKATQKIDEKAIPILGRPQKPQKETVHRTPPHQPTPTRPNVVPYGEQAGSWMQRSIPQTGTNGPTTVNNGNFGTMFPWYVQQINDRMAQNWYKSSVDSSTPRGSRVYLTFTINRDGSVANGRIAQTSGSPTLDTTCMQALQRVGAFPPLPSAYNQSTLMVSYYCEY